MGRKLLIKSKMNNKSIDEDELVGLFAEMLINKELKINNLLGKCVKISKEYHQSKIEELNKWINENRMRNEFADIIYYTALKAKIKSL